MLKRKSELSRALMPRLLSVAIASDGIVEWHKYTGGEHLCKRFPLAEWHLIISDVDTDEKWEDILRSSSYINCYILKRCKSHETIGFVYTKHEDNNGRIRSVHGGGWGKSMELSLFYYRGLILMINNLLHDGIRVRTSCLRDNTRAFRFLRSIGFVPYFYTDTYVYMWINEKRLNNSIIYKYLYQ